MTFNAAKSQHVVYGAQTNGQLAQLLFYYCYSPRGPLGGAMSIVDYTKSSYRSVKIKGELS